VVRRKGSVRVGRDRLDIFTLPAPLDGGLTVRLTGPRRADLDLFLFNHRNKLVARSNRRHSREKVSYLVCGGRKVKIAVRAYEGGGAFRLLSRVP
jgi:hypothetical protein